MKNRFFAAAILLLAAFFNAPVFAQNAGTLSVKEQIKNLQAAIIQQGARWVAGETALSNLSEEEKMMRVGLNFTEIDAPPITDLGDAEVPPALDWRNYNGKNYVTGVRNQAKCGSCWAFAMTAGLESYVLKTRELPGTDLDLSEQVMLSCSGVGSCNGGYLSPSYLVKTGLPEEAAYPYTATNGDCASALEGWQANAYKIGSYGSVKKDLNAIKQAIAKYGGLPTAMMVYEDFMHYKSGVYSYVSGKRLGGHAIFLVGYNDAEKYFIVKNSWSEKWGENGYFNIAYSEMTNSISFGMSTVAYKAPVKEEALDRQVEVSVLEEEKSLEDFMPLFRPAFEWAK
ncbi:MAG: hypothetical protein COT17_06255 [Elusimicrobia bacterium CG08_land_8_20_14_0_20_51_18]|nr:MAG: hypothetical protein COT17_06255 [Elusimicrobia bacterium CG08_land_8_20_14_0_20_51_18]